MANQKIVGIIENRLSEGIDIRAVCNMLVQSGYDQREVDEAVQFVRDNGPPRQQAPAQNRPVATNDVSGQRRQPHPDYQYQPEYTPPFQKYDKYFDRLEKGENMTIVYIIGVVFLIISAVVAMFLFGIF
ncbi:MAG: hypothetical protein JW716_01175 [Candidatus Aenigmarchaeota archaeon]|nr:hypothetical protein [Candidatus Aenigmarchaeota archaeon]